MTPETQRIAIAEACGWRGIPPEDPLWWKKGDDRQHVTGLPDYLNDLNAMHEAESKMTPMQQIDYSTFLMRKHDGLTTQVFECIHATAAQRAEAFLRTIDKWDDSK